MHRPKQTGLKPPGVGPTCGDGRPEVVAILRNEDGLDLDLAA